MESRAIGIISDTHGNNILMENVCYFLKNEKCVDTIYHLGDNYEDGIFLSSMGYNVKVVPGLWCDQFHDWKTPKVIIEEINQVKIAFAHTLELILKSSGKDCNIQCFGHTHTPIVKVENNKVLFNPGQLKRNVDRAQEASFGIIKFDINSINFVIISAVNIQKVLCHFEINYDFLK